MCVRARARAPVWVGQRDIEKMAAQAILYSHSADAAAAAVLGAADAGGYVRAAAATEGDRV